MNESAPLNMSVETGQPPGLPRISPYTSIGACFVLSVIYVASLYIWNSKHNRDHPVTIKRRFCSVSVVMLFAPLFVYLFSSQQLLDSTPFTDILGLRLAGLWQAIVVPMLLTMLLFLGPLCVQMQNETMKVLLDLSYIKGTVTSLLWIRNHIMAPLSEEFVFRACMMPLILQSFSPVAAVFITPLFFGTAHVHHIAERLSLGVELKTAIFISCFQFVYTTLFGFYSSFLFARTEHFIAPFLVHAFCNHMGFPDIQDLWQQHIGRRIILGLCYVLGLVGWIFLLPYATQPDFYLNKLYWNL